MTELLEKAIRELEEGERVEALGTLLAAWRAQRAPEIADVIDTLSAELTVKEPPFRQRRDESVDQTWQRALHSDRPSAFERVLEIVPRGRSPASRLVGLLSIPPDPRFGRRAIAWMRRPPSFSSRVKFEDRLVDVLDHVLDVRNLVYFEQQGIREARERHTWSLPLHRDPMQRHGERLRALAARLEPVPKPLLKRLHRAVEPRRAVAADPTPLFDLVYADPDDDAARAVLADLLQQHGDPRGELIALQLARHGTRKRRSPREAELLTTWAKPWLGALSEVLDERSVHYERGFVSSARLHANVGWRNFNRALREAGEWSTLVRLDVSAARDQTFLLTARLPSLRHVTGVLLSLVAPLGELGPRPWETVGFQVDTWRTFREAFRRGDGAATFPALRKLLLESDPMNGREHLAAVGEHLCELAASLPHLEELEGRFDATSTTTLLLDPRGARIRRIVTRTEQVDILFDRAARKLVIRSQQPWIDTGVDDLVDASILFGRSRLVDRIEIHIRHQGFLRQSRRLPDLHATVNAAGIDLQIIDVGIENYPFV